MGILHIVGVPLPFRLTSAPEVERCVGFHGGSCSC